MAAIHADTISIPARALQTALERLQDLSGTALSAATDLRDWDCVISAGSWKAALYEVTSAKLAALIIRAHYGALAQQLLRCLDAGAEEHWRRHVKEGLIVALERGDDSWLPEGTRWASLLPRALALAVTELERMFGADRSRWRWGDLHRTALEHRLARVFPEAAPLLNPPNVELDGDADTPLLNGFKVGAAFEVSFSSVNRYIFDPADWSQGRWIVPLGASGHPGSPHYSDQQPLWAAVATVPQLWDWDEIGAQTETEQVLRALTGEQ
jgi:penicillin amidase